MGLKITLNGVDAAFEVIRGKQSSAIRKELVDRSNTMAKRLSDATPVDTGFARDQWKVDEPKGNLNTGISVKVSNDAPYIEDLNRGTSKQAPAYFIESVALQFGKPVGQMVKVIEKE